MFSPAAALAIDETQKRELESVARAGSTPQKLARQCEVILLASQGIPNHAIAQRTGLSRPTVISPMRVGKRRPSSLPERPAVLES